MVADRVFSVHRILPEKRGELSCYEKVKGEISLFRDIVDLMKVLSMFLCLLAVCLLSAGIGYVGSIGESFCFCFAV